MSYETSRSSTPIYLMTMIPLYSQPITSAATFLGIYWIHWSYRAILSSACKKLVTYLRGQIGSSEQCEYGNHFHFVQKYTKPELSSGRVIQTRNIVGDRNKKE